MSVERLLREELEQEIAELGKMEFGSDDYKATVDGVSKLMDKLNDSRKIELEAEDKALNREIETDLKVEQMKVDKKQRIFQNIAEVGKIIIPVAVTIWGTITTLEFEKTGTVTTIPGRNFVNDLFKKKK